MTRHKRLVWAGVACLALVGTAQAAPRAGASSNDAGLQRTRISRAEAAGRTAAFMGANQGQAYLLESAGTGLAQRSFSVALPAYKVYGLSADGTRVAYRPLDEGRPSPQLYVEDLAGGHAEALPIEHYVIEAAWSPTQADRLAFTYSSGDAFGIAIIDVKTGDIDDVQSKNVLADYLAWDGNGAGLYFYNAIDRVRTARDETTGRRMHEHGYAVLSPRHHTLATGELRELALTALPAGFPAMKQTAPENLSEPTDEAARTLRNALPLLAGELPEDLYAFTSAVPERALEVSGDDLLGDAPLYVRELPNGERRAIATGKLLRLLPDGAVVGVNLGNGRAVRFVDWSGASAPLATAAVSYNLPLKSSYITQGGCSYPAPGNCNSSFSHTCGSSMAYAYDIWQSAGHILASATGTVSYRMSTVTCNSCDSSGCGIYSSSCSSNSGWGNAVIIEHADTSWTKYTHMAYNTAQVSVGNATCPGRYLGNQGGTGCTSGNGCGDHLHFQRQNSSALSGTSIAIDFADANDPLSCGSTYTSASNETTTCGGGGYTFICDDGQACMVKYGPAQYWTTQTTCGGTSLGYSGDMVWTYVNGTVQSNYARWTPTLSGAGNYTVSVFIPRCYGTSQQAKYRILANGTSYYATVNQNNAYDAWVTLGTYYFASSGTQYVELSDATGEAASTYRQLAFDAVRFVK